MKKPLADMFREFTVPINENLDKYGGQYFTLKERSDLYGVMVDAMWAKIAEFEKLGEMEVRSMDIKNLSINISTKELLERATIAIGCRGDKSLHGGHCSAHSLDMIKELVRRLAGLAEVVRCSSERNAGL